MNSSHIAQFISQLSLNPEKRRSRKGIMAILEIESQIGFKNKRDIKEGLTWN